MTPSPSIGGDHEASLASLATILEVEVLELQDRTAPPFRFTLMAALLISCRETMITAGSSCSSERVLLNPGCVISNCLCYGLPPSLPQIPLRTAYFRFPPVIGFDRSTSYAFGPYPDQSRPSLPPVPPSQSLHHSATASCPYWLNW